MSGESVRKCKLTPKAAYSRIANKIKNVFVLDYGLDGGHLAFTSNFRYICVTVFGDMSWKSHVDNLTSTAERKLGGFRRNLKLATEKAKLTA